jgi:hypothetical protein
MSLPTSSHQHHPTPAAGRRLRALPITLLVALLASLLAGFIGHQAHGGQSTERQLVTDQLVTYPESAGQNRAANALFAHGPEADMPRPNSVISHQLVAATGDNGLWIRDPVEANINWRQVGHANNVTGLAFLSGKLWAATSDNTLWTRDPVEANINWQQVGHANNVRAMTAINGKLWAATSDNKLWTRGPVEANINWQQVGHANNVRAMTAIP